MAHGENAKMPRGKEWWKKRPLSGTSVSHKSGMKFWKRLLHRIERRQSKDQINKEKP